jgi:hypothetical protein
MSLEALAARRSVRAHTEQTLTLAEVGQLLCAAQRFGKGNRDKMTRLRGQQDGTVRMV